MTLKSLLVLVLAVLFAVTPFLTQPFTGYDPSIFPVVIEKPSIQPSGYAFSIWLVIYLWLIAHAGFGFWVRAKSLDWDATRLPLAGSLAFGTAWLFYAASFPLLATIGLIFMLVLALTAFLASDEFYDRWLLSGALAIYAGWLSAAASVSTGILLAGYGLLTDTEAAFAMLATVGVLAGVVQFLRPEMPVYGATVIWALIGVVVKNATANLPVAIVAAGVAFGMGSLLAWQWRKRRNSI